MIAAVTARLAIWDLDCHFSSKKTSNRPFQNWYKSLNQFFIWHDFKNYYIIFPQKHTNSLQHFNLALDPNLLLPCIMDHTLMGLIQANMHSQELDLSLPNACLVYLQIEWIFSKLFSICTKAIINVALFRLVNVVNHLEKTVI